MNNCPNCSNPYQTGEEVCRTCGFILPVTTAIISAGEVLQTRYEIQELIHSGGMGYVYLATDKRLYDRICIVKQVKEPIKSDDHRKKLEEEALRMSKLNHPNVAMILDHFIDGGYYFLVVERIYGKTLSEVFKERRGHLTENEVVTWAISICDVVSYLHKEGIVHRDISPDNIMLTGEGSIKFIDFGTLRELGYIVAGGTAGMGKYGYTPPEQWQGRPEFRSDIFALGATIYYLLTGFLPLSREYLTRQRPQKDDFNPSFPPIRTRNPNVSPQLEAALQKALRLDINDRYSSVEEFGEALKNLGQVEVKKMPALSLETRHLDFANVKSGATVTSPLILKNTGTGKLTGTLTTNQPWLKASPGKIELETGELKGKVTVDTRHLAPGSYGAGEIKITTNGGQAKVAVDLSIATEAKPEAISKPKTVEARPKPMAKPKARMPLRWALISLGIVLFLIAGVSGVYFTSGHLFTTSATSPPETATPPPETTTLPPDTTPPVISQVKVAGYTGETATITWETDEDAVGQVEYGTSNAYGKPATTDGELTTSHSIELTGLQPNTTYHFRVKARDRSENEIGSVDQAFTTWVAEKDWKKYVNDKYGFSIQYPNNWKASPDLIAYPWPLEWNGVPAPVPAISIQVLDADAPLSADWIVASSKSEFLNLRVVSPPTETTLADGTKAYTYKTKLTSVRFYEVTTFRLDADKGNKRIQLVIFTVEGGRAPYDEKLFSQVAHTLRFTSDE
jgi:serine/threonine-protein kinase